MKYVKHMFKFGLTLTVISVMLSGCTLKEPSDDVLKKVDIVPVDENVEVTLVLAEMNSFDTIAGMVDLKFKEEVEEKSGGKIKIDIQPNGVLGSETDILDTMIGGGGTIDMARVTAGILTSYGSKKAILLSLPYTFTSREHLYPRSVWHFRIFLRNKIIWNINSDRISVRKTYGRLQCCGYIKALQA